MQITEQLATPPAPQALDVVIMAAGKGTRMHSRIPKVLHTLAGRALLHHVLDTAASLQARRAVVVTGHGAIEVEANCSDYTRAGADFSLCFVRQEPQLGTGHAVQQAVPLLHDDAVVLVLSGDVPLTEADTLQTLVALCAGQRLALLTLHLDDPSGYGRVVRTDACVRGIVEHKDASAEQRAITEVYSGILAAPARALKRWLALLDQDNAQGEFYLTDIVRHAVAEGTDVVAHRIHDAVQVTGVNSPAQLATLERAFQHRAAERLMQAGVRLADPARLDVRGQLLCGQDVSIDVNCVFEGQVRLGDSVRIDAHCVIANANIEAGAHIRPFSHIDGTKPGGVTVGPHATVGPFARLRSGAQLGPEVHIGNFVEVKNATLGAGSKANHLAYVGDATLGARVNFGAGSITANYDGANKHHTRIEDDVHVGSNCVLVAPITLGAGGTVGAGSTLTKNTEAGALSVARGKAISIAQWQRPAKTPKA